VRSTTDLLTIFDFFKAFGFEKDVSLELLHANGPDKRPDNQVMQNYLQSADILMFKPLKYESFLLSVVPLELSKPISLFSHLCHLPASLSHPNDRQFACYDHSHSRPEYLYPSRSQPLKSNISPASPPVPRYPRACQRTDEAHWGIASHLGCGHSDYGCHLY
jgi:hypothetical protein